MLHCTTPQLQPPDATLLHTHTLHYTTLGYTRRQYTTLQCTTLHYTTLLYNYNYNCNYNYTTLIKLLQLQYTTTTTALHHTISSSCVWGDRCNHCSHSKKHNSNHLSVHQWICSAIRDSQQPTSPIGFLFLKLPPLPCAALLVFEIARCWRGIQNAWWHHGILDFSPPFSDQLNLLVIEIPLKQIKPN